MIDVSMVFLLNEMNKLSDSAEKVRVLTKDVAFDCISVLVNMHDFEMWGRLCDLERIH